MKKDLGFTLVELLVVISIIILIFILLTRKLKNKIKRLLGKKPLSSAEKKSAHHSWFLGF